MSAVPMLRRLLLAVRLEQDRLAGEPRDLRSAKLVAMPPTWGFRSGCHHCSSCGEGNANTGASAAEFFACLRD